MLQSMMLYSVYIPYSQLHPGQIRYASKNVEEKRKKAIATGAALCVNNCWIYKYHNGTSIMEEKNALPVVKSVVGYVLVDGHHDVLSSIALGATMIPIKVIADLSHLSVQQFWLEAEKLGLIYPYALGGEYQVPPIHFKDLIDDPNRYFAAIVARKCEGPTTSPANSRGFDYPLWRKVGKDIPFIEFMIADIWWNNGIYYTYAMGDNPSIKFVEKARTVLKKNSIKGLKLVSKRTYYLDIPNLCGL
jgi:hypothetical protein